MVLSSANFIADHYSFFPIILRFFKFLMFIPNSKYQSTNYNLHSFQSKLALLQWKCWRFCLTANCRNCLYTVSFLNELWDFLILELLFMYICVSSIVFKRLLFNNISFYSKTILTNHYIVFIKITWISLIALETKFTVSKNKMFYPLY